MICNYLGHKYVVMEIRFSFKSKFIKNCMPQICLLFYNCKDLFTYKLI